MAKQQFLEAVIQPGMQAHIQVRLANCQCMWAERRVYARKPCMMVAELCRMHMIPSAQTDGSHFYMPAPTDRCARLCSARKAR